MTTNVWAQAGSLVAIVVLGYLIKRWGWVRVEHFSVLSVIVLRITLPCALLTTFNGRSLDFSLFWLPVVGVAVNVILGLLGWFLNRAKTRTDQAFGVLNTGSFNVGAFTMPYVSGMVGPQALVYATMYDIGNSIVAGGFSYATAKSLVSGERARPVAFVKNILSSPVVLTYLVVITLSVLHVRLPAPVLAFTSTAGAANSFLAMLMIGVGLELDLSKARYRKALKILAVRYPIVVTVAILSWLLLPLPREVRTVLIATLFSPVAAITPAFTAEVRGDVQLSTFLCSATILVAIIVQPLLLAVLS